MKSYKIFLGLVILLVSFQIGLGQEKPKAELIDDMGEENCEGFWSRFDGFFNLLQNEPSSTGYITIYGKKDASLPMNLRYERLIDGIVRFRNLDRRRLVIIRGELRDNEQIEFWKVPAGAETPTFNEGNWDLKIEQNKPFILQRYSEGDGICPTNTSVKLFADYLTANPNLRAHIVITGKTDKTFAVTKTDLLNQLANEYKISPKRLKFFYVKDKNSVNFDDIEYWILPNKKK